MIDYNGGIYAITNKKTLMYYIGSTVNFSRRWFEHKSELRRNAHGNPYLQHSWNKHGEEAFEFDILEYLDSSKELHLAEQFWMDLCREEGKELYNCGLAARNARLGCIVSKSTRCKLREANVGKKHSKEARRKMSEARAGVPRGPMSKETKCKISAVKKGVKLPPVSKETRQRMSKSFTGRKYTEEQRRRNSEAHKGIRPSAETRQRMSEAHKGERNAMYGKRHSEETKQKISIAVKRAYAAKAP